MSPGTVSRFVIAGLTHRDIVGVGAFTEHKHWGCTGPLVIDARRKPHHAPPLIEDRQVSAKIDALAAKGGPIAKYL